MKETLISRKQLSVVCKHCKMEIRGNSQETVLQNLKVHLDAKHPDKIKGDRSTRETPSEPSLS